MAHLSRTKFFWYKPLLLLSSTYWPFSLCKIFKKFLQWIQSYEGASFFGPKCFISPKQNFFWKKIINIIFIYLLAFFIVQNLKKNSYSGSRVLRMHRFGAQNFFWKIIKITVIYLLVTFIVQNFKKNSSTRSRVMRKRNFWAQNGPFPQMRIFFRKPVNEPCFFRSYLSTCQKSKSDVYLLVKYMPL